MSRRRRVGAAATYLAAWFVLASVAWLVLFLQSERTITVASHDAVISPDLGGQVTVRTGPVLPDLRADSGSVIGVDVQLGKTDAPSLRVLLERYALLASQPEGPVTKVEDTVADMAVEAAVRGAAIGMLPIVVWAVVGADRRAQLWARVPTREGALAGVLVVLVLVTVWAPWEGEEETLEKGQDWVPLSTFLGPQVPLPAELDRVEVRGDVTTSQTRRLIASAIDSYDSSKVFYDAAADHAGRLELREPEDDETVVVLVSDRHDNIGMDRVARAVGEAGGATAVFDAGDDTSTGERWEAFSLDSLDAVFGDLEDRWAVAGNHDNGKFVGDYLAERGWQMLGGEIVDGPAGTRLLGVQDPRSSGLGSWRDEGDLSFGEVEERLADEACRADEDDERVQTLLVHDTNLGRTALERGCVDLVLGGHTHVVSGPTRVVGENDETGYTFTTGTTGGAAYAIAVGSKIRRPAVVSLVTYTDEGPTGIQAVTLQSNGVFQVGDYVPLDDEVPTAEQQPPA